MNRFVIFLTAALALIASGCGSKEKITSTEKAVVPVGVATPFAHTDNTIFASGQIEATQTTAISTRMMGKITSLKANVGDRVSKGQILATISDEDIRSRRAQTDAMIAEAEAHFSAAQKDYTRYNNLYNQQSATAKELDMMTLQYSAAKSKVEAARQMKNEMNAMLGYSTLRAPFDGVITQKMTELGSIASPGMPLLMMENSGQKQVTATVAEADISSIKLQQPATVVVKSSGKNFKGKVTQISPSSLFSGAQYIIKVSIPSEEQRDAVPGMYVNVTLQSSPTTPLVKSDAVLVPKSSIVHKDELTGIYTLGENNKALLRWIRLGKTYGDKVEVISGLAKNEKFIVSADGKLVNGAKVKVK